MDFKFKTQEELKIMSDAEVTNYQADLEAYRVTQMKDTVTTEVKEALNKAQETLKNFLIDEVTNQMAEKTNQTKNETRFVKEMLKNVEEFDTKDSNYRSNITIKASGYMGTATVQNSVAGGYSPLFGNYIDAEVGHTPKPELCILPLINLKTQPNTEVIYHTSRYNEEGDAEFLAEGGLKPIAKAKWITDQTNAKEVALRWKFTKRLMKHAPSVVFDFAEHAVELMELKMDDGALSGDGIGANMLGITNTAVSAAFIPPVQLANQVATPNIYDAIIAIASQIGLLNFKGNLTAVLNTVWEAKMKTLKNVNGDYIIPPFVTPGGDMVGSVTVKFSNRILDTHILVGDLRKFNVVVCDEIEYAEGYENDDFSKNLVSKKLEAFIASYIKRADIGSIVYDEIDVVLLAIKKV